jgi:hypothetical protein
MMLSFHDPQSGMQLSDSVHPEPTGVKKIINGARCRAGPGHATRRIPSPAARPAVYQVYGENPKKVFR